MDNNNTDLSIELSAATMQTSAATEEMSSSISNTARLASEVVKGTDEIQSILTGFSGRMADQNLLANDIVADIKDKLNNVNEVARNAEKQAEKAKELSGMYQNVDIATKNILEAIEFIDDIAEQIRVLTFNAKIEASHAGHYGRGFEVIADEMERLTLKTKEQSSEVSSILKNNMDTLKQLSEANEDTVKSFINISNNIHKAANDVTEVTVGVDYFADTGKTVSKDISAITNKITSINNAMQEVSNAIEQNAAAVLQIQESTAEINKMANSLRNDMVMVSNCTEESVAITV
jgi:methyl-accepting chemotaxis protein